MVIDYHDDDVPCLQRRLQAGVMINGEPGPFPPEVILFSQHSPIIGIAGVISTVKRSLGLCVTFNNDTDSFRF